MEKENIIGIISIIVIFGAFFWMVHGMIRLEPFASANFCGHQGYDGVISSYSNYYHTITCVSMDRNHFIEKTFNVTKTFWGYK